MAETAFSSASVPHAEHAVIRPPRTVRHTIEQRVSDSRGSCDQSLTVRGRGGVSGTQELWWHQGLSPSQRAGGVGPAEAFRRRHPVIPVRIITTDPALPYAKPPLSKSYLCGRQATLDLHSPDWFGRHNVELLRGITVEHIDPGIRS